MSKAKIWGIGILLLLILSNPNKQKHTEFIDYQIKSHFWQNSPNEIHASFGVSVLETLLESCGHYHNYLIFSETKCYLEDGRIFQISTGGAGFISFNKEILKDETFD